MDATSRLSYLMSLLDNDKADDFVLYAIAQEHQKQDNLEESRLYYERLKAQNPAYVGLYYHLAHVYAELDDTETAIKTIDEGIERANEQKDLHALSELKNAKMNISLGL